ncbi:MAG TPA: hypothetical protein VIY86_09465, partial [Pirellulaceae bacterium]
MPPIRILGAIRDPFVGDVTIASFVGAVPRMRFVAAGAWLAAAILMIRPILNSRGVTLRGPLIWAFAAMTILGTSACLRVLGMDSDTSWSVLMRELGTTAALCPIVALF